MVLAREYWNRNQDPFGHREIGAGSFDAAWQAALRAQRAPDFRFMFQELGEIRGLRVLELGRGHGTGTLQAAREGAIATGLDFAESRCAAAREMCRKFHPETPVTFLAGDADAIPARDGSFDRIFARDILMYTDPARVLADCARVLRPGGRAVFDEALPDHPLVALHRRWLSPQAHRAIARYLDADRLRSLGAPGLVPGEPRFFYLLSALAFYALFILRSERLFQLALAGLSPLDGLLDRGLPGVRRFAWRGVVSFRKG